MLVRCRRSREHDPRRIGAKRSFVHQFLGVASKEALAKRPLAPHQINDGTTTTSLLIEQIQFNVHSLLCHHVGIVKRENKQMYENIQNHWMEIKTKKNRFYWYTFSVLSHIEHSERMSSIIQSLSGTELSTLPTVHRNQSCCQFRKTKNVERKKMFCSHTRRMTTSKSICQCI